MVYVSVHVNNLPENVNDQSETGFKFPVDVNGVFTLPNTKDDKTGCLELCGSAHTAQSQVYTLNFIRSKFCVNLSASVSVSVSGIVKAPWDLLLIDILR